MFGKRGLFGKKGGAAPTPERQGSSPTVRRDSDGKRRVFGEETYEKHGDFLREIGFDDERAARDVAATYGGFDTMRSMLAGAPAR